MCKKNIIFTVVLVWYGLNALSFCWQWLTILLTLESMFVLTTQDELWPGVKVLFWRPVVVQQLGRARTNFSPHLCSKTAARNEPTLLDLPRICVEWPSLRLSSCFHSQNQDEWLTASPLEESWSSASRRGPSFAAEHHRRIADLRASSYGALPFWTFINDSASSIHLRSGLNTARPLLYSAPFRSKPFLM